MSDKGWALILGASSGFGGATAVELARNGFDIFGVHLDMRQTLPNAHAIIKTIEDAAYARCSSTSTQQTPANARM
jgi:NAD(P)-dependent dehydrogenase (short-subunit alcohol dehydrogenase family)